MRHFLLSHGTTAILENGAPPSLRFARPRNLVVIDAASDVNQTRGPDRPTQQHEHKGRKIHINFHDIAYVFDKQPANASPASVASSNAVSVSLLNADQTALISIPATLLVSGLLLAEKPKVLFVKSHPQIRTSSRFRFSARRFISQSPHSTK